MGPSLLLQLGRTRTALQPGKLQLFCRWAGSLLTFLVLLEAAPAAGERGALSLDLSAGVAGLNLAAPYTNGEANTVGVGFEFMLGVRYALLNELEFTAAAYFEPNVGYTYEGVSIKPPPSPQPLQGTLTTTVHLFGAVGGIRYVTGLVWKLVVGLEIGWCHRTYSGLQFTGQSNFAIPGFGTDNLVLQPLLGVEWAFADHWSASLLPRVTLLVGPDSTIAASVLLTFSYSWFL